MEVRNPMPVIVPGRAPGQGRRRPSSAEQENCRPLRASDQSHLPAGSRRLSECASVMGARLAARVILSGASGAAGPEAEVLQARRRCPAQWIWREFLCRLISARTGRPRRMLTVLKDVLQTPGRQAQGAA